jgi:putative NADH-flavin reductase
MKLTIIGSTGGTGTQVIAEAARRHHMITAFTRRPEMLKDRESLDRVVHGDGKDPDAVTNAVTDSDAVIAIVKASSPRGPHETAKVARVLVDAMQAVGTSRLVMSSAYPIVAVKPRLQMILVRNVLKAGYHDLVETERIVTASTLDWTIARLYGLLDGPPSGQVQISRGLFDKPGVLTRADAAATLLDLAEGDTYSRAAVNISGKGESLMRTHMRQVRTRVREMRSR